MKWHKLPQSAIDLKTPIQLVQLGGKKFCLIYHEGNWHATSSKCPHAGANLVGGWCENRRLICPYHRHSFDLANGKGAAGQNNCITIYRIEEREDGVYIELPKSLFKKLFNLFD
jgi:nitrite reductase/ring-hydroxylating ferredoxin subunit